MAAAARAMVKVFQIASMIIWFASISLYHFREKPPHTAMDLLSLKDSTIRVAMGR